MRTRALLPGLLTLLVAGFTARGQGLEEPVPWSEIAPNISIRVTLTGGDRDTSRPAEPLLRLRGDRGNRELRLAPRRGAGTRSGEQATVASQLLTVANGRSGSIFVGERVPYLEWLTTFGRDWSAPVDEPFDFKWDEVGAHLSVHARTRGTPANPWITLVLTPELRGLVDERPHRVAYTRASTRLICGIGRTLPVAAAGKAAPFYRKFLSGYGADDAIEAVRITVTPTILQKPLPPRTGPREIRLGPLPPRIEDLRLPRDPLPEIPRMKSPGRLTPGR